ncbi:MAG TPA: pentapeptide repeat-containing protein [Candidatus Obscuribacterales bacterium]
MDKLNGSELLDEYASGRRDFSEIDLSEAYLFQADLREIDIAGGNLQKIYLPYANLSQANLHSCQLQAAQLSQDLRNCHSDRERLNNP